MKTTKILFTLSLLGIFILIFLSQTTPETKTETINSIQYSTNKITIFLENNTLELIIFDNKPINAKKGDIIKFQGKENLYKNKKQIIVDKLFLPSVSPK